MSEYISLKDAAKELDVVLGTLHYYVRRLKIETHKFELDKQAYLERADFERIKSLKDGAAKRKEGSAA